MTDLTVANTILKQMGGAGRIKAMIGVKGFVGLENGVTFSFPNPNPGKPNNVQIDLNGMDEYEVTFRRIRGKKVHLVEEVTGLQAEDLKRVFEAQTGLYLSFGR